MSARDKLIRLAEFVLSERTDAADWKDDSGTMMQMAQDAIDELQREQEGPHAPLRCVLCDKEVGVMETATHKCV